MLIIALVLAVIGLAALVTAVVTSNELIAWVCIGASVIGVLLLIVDALRERSKGARGPDADEADEQTAVLAASEPAEDYPDDASYQDDTSYQDDASYPDDTSYPDETEVFETTEVSSETSDADATAVGDDADAEPDQPADADDSTKRN